MPGTLTIKPIQATFTHNKDFLVNKMDPYCEILLGGQRVTTSVCHHGGKHPYWNDIITLKSNNEPVLYVNIKDKDTFSHDDNLGMTQVDLKNVTSYPSGPQWYPVMGRSGPEGEVLLDIVYNPVQTYTQPTAIYPGTPIQSGFPTQILPSIPTYIPTTAPITQPPVVIYNAPGYPSTQPTMAGYPMNQPIVSYPQGQPMATQITFPNTHPIIMQQPNTTAYNQPMGTGYPLVQGQTQLQTQLQPQPLTQVYPTQGYGQNLGGYGGIYYK